MSDLTQADIESIKAQRHYPVFDASDDDFHDEVLTHHWWETETNWFSWNVPERHMGGWTYCQARPNANICNGGVWLWDDTAAFSWDLPYHVNYSGLRLPERSESVTCGTTSGPTACIPRSRATHEVLAAIRGF